MKKKNKKGKRKKRESKIGIVAYIIAIITAIVAMINSSQRGGYIDDTGSILLGIGVIIGWTCAAMLVYKYMYKIKKEKFEMIFVGICGVNAISTTIIILWDFI